MNRKYSTALVLAAAALCGSAFAGTTVIGDATVDNTGFQPTRTRGEVQGELAQYRQAGVNPWSRSYSQQTGFQGTKTREQVVGEFLASRDEVAALTSQDSGSALLSREEAAAPAQLVAAHR